MIYFFDYLKNGVRTEDTEGSLFQSEKALRLEALRALAEVVFNTLRHGDFMDSLTVCVRDELGTTVYECGVVFKETLI